jgi:hypothetical protein
MRFAKSVLFPSHQGVNQSELGAAGCILRSVGHDFLKSWSRYFKIFLRTLTISADQIDASLQITFWERHARLRVDFDEIFSPARSSAARSCTLRNRFRSGTELAGPLFHKANALETVCVDSFLRRDNGRCFTRDSEGPRRGSY